MTNGEDIFEKYENLEEYPLITKEDWELIKETYPKDEVKERLAEIFMKHPLPYATDKYTIEDARNDYMKLKGIRWNIRDKTVFIFFGDSFVDNFFFAHSSSTRKL